MLDVKIQMKARKIARYSAVGHSNNTCGSVTCLARTFIRLVRALPGVKILVDVPQEGSLFIDVHPSAELSPARAAALEGYSEFVLRAITDLSMEFKDEVTFTVTVDI